MNGVLAFHYTVPLPQRAGNLQSVLLHAGVVRVRVRKLKADESDLL